MFEGRFQLGFVALKQMSNETMKFKFQRWDKGFEFMMKIENFESDFLYR